MRRADLVLFALSALIIFLVGLHPLLMKRRPVDDIRQECQLFYGPSGEDEVEDCRKHMLHNAPSGG